MATFRAYKPHGGRGKGHAFLVEPHSLWGEWGVDTTLHSRCGRLTRGILGLLGERRVVLAAAEPTDAVTCKHCLRLLPVGAVIERHPTTDTDRSA